jgi:hypothetical protein
MASTGVSFTVGRERNAKYGETINGVQLKSQHQFPNNISPYVTPGDPTSGLVPGVYINPVKAPDGTGDTCIQAYNYRLTTTKVVANMVPFPEPASYNPERYELLGRVFAAGALTSLGQVFSSQALRNSKYDWNNNGPLSTDYIGANHGYPRAGYAVRAQMWIDHKEWMLGLIKFLKTDSRVPAALQTDLANWGLCKDEYTDNGNWSYQLYVREARRMVSDFVMTEKYCNKELPVTDAIAYGSYKMDSHNCQRVVVNGMIKNEGDVQIAPKNGPYPIAYRAIVPKTGECTNLIVPVCLSASHIAYGSIRMEPVFMMMGEAAGAAAVLAIDSGVPVQLVNYRKLAQSIGIPLSEKTGIVMDTEWPDSNGVVSITGTWTTASSTPGFNGSGYLHDGNIGKGTNTVRYQPAITTGGKYEVYIRWTANANRAANVPVKISHASGTFDTTVNEQQGGGTWVNLGTFSFNAGTAGYLEIATTGTNGYVIADAVLFSPVSNTGTMYSHGTAPTGKKISTLCKQSATYDLLGRNRTAAAAKRTLNQGVYVSVKAKTGAEKWLIK